MDQWKVMFYLSYLYVFYFCSKSCSHDQSWYPRLSHVVGRFKLSSMEVQATKDLGRGLTVVPCIEGGHTSHRSQGFGRAQ
jgi:hypothetical protein